MSDASEQVIEQVFENKEPSGGRSTKLKLFGFGLIAFAVVNFVLALGTRHGLLSLHLTTTLPTMLAIGLIARGISLSRLPSRIVVDSNGLEVTSKRETRRYPWSEIGSATCSNVLNSQQTCLRITDTVGKTIVQVDESFPDYHLLSDLVQSRIEAKPDDTSLLIARRRAKRMALLSFALGSFSGLAAVFTGWNTYEKHRVNELLARKGVPGEAEIVGRFVAPDGVTKRLEYRVAGSEVKNVEISPAFWNALEYAKTVEVVYVPEEPGASRLAFGEFIEDGFPISTAGGYLLSALGGLIAILMLGYTPFAWMGYDLDFDNKQSTLKIKRYGRVIRSSKANHPGPTIRSR